MYGTPECPDCRVLKAWFGSEGIAHAERDLSDPAIVAGAKAHTGVRVAPITVVDGQHVVYGTFAEQMPKIAAVLSIGV